MENGQRNSGRKKMVMQTSHASSLVQSVAFSWCPFFDVSLLHIPLACLDWHRIICSSRSWPEIVRMLPSNRSLLLVHWHDQSLGSCAGPSTQLGSIPPPIKAASFYAPPWAQHCFTPPLASACRCALVLSPKQCASPAQSTAAVNLGRGKLLCSKVKTAQNALLHFTIHFASPINSKDNRHLMLALHKSHLLWMQAVCGRRGHKQGFIRGLRWVALVGN